MKSVFLLVSMLMGCSDYVPAVTNPKSIYIPNEESEIEIEDTGEHQQVNKYGIDTANPNGSFLDDPNTGDSDTGSSGRDTYYEDTGSTSFDTAYTPPVDTATPEDTETSEEEIPSPYDVVCPSQSPYWDTAELIGNGSGYCVVLESGALECNSYYSLTSISGDFLTIDADFDYGGLCGVKTNYKASCSPLTAWYGTNFGQFNPPNDDFCDITISEEFACGILTDGSITCWGRGDTEESNGWHGYGGSVPSGNDWVKIQTAGSNAVCAMDVDGYIYCWGNFLATSTIFSTPSDSAIDFDTFDTYGVILKQDGSYEEWGYEGSDTHTSANPSYEGRRISITTTYGTEIMCPIYSDNSSPQCNNQTVSSSLFNQSDAYVDPVVLKDPWISIMEDGSMTFESSAAFGNYTATLPPNSVRTVPFPE